MQQLSISRITQIRCFYRFIVNLRFASAASFAPVIPSCIRYPAVPVCKKCAKVCRAPENGKSHEGSYDSSWDFGALEGTRIPGPLIKSQMLYRLSYERIFCGKTIPPNNITTIGCKKQERHLKKRKFQFYTTKLLKKPLRPALQQLHQQAGIDADHRGRLAQIHGLALGQVG